VKTVGAPIAAFNGPNCCIMKSPPNTLKYTMTASRNKIFNGLFSLRINLISKNRISKYNPAITKAPTNVYVFINISQKNHINILPHYKVSIPVKTGGFFSDKLSSKTCTSRASNFKEGASLKIVNLSPSSSSSASSSFLWSFRI